MLIVLYSEVAACYISTEIDGVNNYRQLLKHRSGVPPVGQLAVQLPLLLT